jgi:hypothetical protein
MHVMFGGTSVSSATEVVLPAPSQTIFWQSPGVCVAVGVPIATSVTPQTFCVHVVATHSLVLGGQSDGIVHAIPASVAAESVMFASLGIAESTGMFASLGVAESTGMFASLGVAESVGMFPSTGVLESTGTFASFAFASVGFASATFASTPFAASVPWPASLCATLESLPASGVMPVVVLSSPEQPEVAVAIETAAQAENEISAERS